MDEENASTLYEAIGRLYMQNVRRAGLISELREQIRLLRPVVPQRKEEPEEVREEE